MVSWYPGTCLHSSLRDWTRSRRTWVPDGLTRLGMGRVGSSLIPGGNLGTTGTRGTRMKRLIISKGTFTNMYLAARYVWMMIRMNAADIHRASDPTSLTSDGIV